ncbi:YdcF family protein [Xanthobacter autotrophicus]|uniref:YdcF family protein n=1 Tax=Xanthobacter autotrophicus TaxID=280 RepID=UPI001E52891B|nr:YdcF family protein [Xanthobacter autotrophicus]UDQ89158.1 YdcF family protein [Xanthobacter autotrophicus]
MDSFFTLSKLFWFAIAPSNALVLLGGLGLVLALARTRRAGMGLLAVSVIGWAVLGFSPIANYLLNPLEERFPIYRGDAPVTGVIILGGAEVPEVGLARGVPAFANAGERAIAFGALARKHPEARLAFIGGSGQLFSDGVASEARMMQMTLPDLGIAPDRVEYEVNSRNTAENAEFAKEMLKPSPGERWLLVTSAFHMPRAVGCFRKAGFNVVPYPVDFRTIGPSQLNDTFSRAASGLDVADVSVKEWVGLVAYYLSGKTSALFPAP